MTLLKALISDYSSEIIFLNKDGWYVSLFFNFQLIQLDSELQFFSKSDHEERKDAIFYFTPVS